jgi:hypothetical protein
MKVSTINERRMAGYWPYYKAQWWDAVNLAWHDVQMRYPDASAARGGGPSQFPPGVQRHLVRVVEVTRRGRRPLAS